MLTSSLLVAITQMCRYQPACLWHKLWLSLKWAAQAYLQHTMATSWEISRFPTRSLPRHFPNPSKQTRKKHKNQTFAVGLWPPYDQLVSLSSMSARYLDGDRRTWVITTCAGKIEKTNVTSHECCRKHHQRPWIGEISDLVFSLRWQGSDVNKATVHNAVNGQGQSRLVLTDRQVNTLSKHLQTFDA